MKVLNRFLASLAVYLIVILVPFLVWGQGKYAPASPLKLKIQPTLKAPRSQISREPVTKATPQTTAPKSEGSSRGGAGNTGGGDEYTADFVNTARLEIYPWLKEHGSTLKPAVDAEEFMKAVDPENIVSSPQVFESCQFQVIDEGLPSQKIVGVPKSKEDRSVPACYNSDVGKIYLSRSRYPIVLRNSSPKRGLIAHEVFRKMGLEGNAYEISSQMSIVNVPRTVPGVGSVANKDACDGNRSYMWSLIEVYIRSVKHCYQLEFTGRIKSQAYEDEKKIVTLIERSYAKAVFTCDYVCEDSLECSGPVPQGACSKSE